MAANFPGHLQGQLSLDKTLLLMLVWHKDTNRTLNYRKLRMVRTGVWRLHIKKLLPLLHFPIVFSHLPSMIFYNDNLKGYIYINQ